MMTLIHVDFEIRRDYIAKVLCINKDKPISTCAGQCYLTKRVKEASEEQQQTNSGNRLNVISFFNEELFTLLFDNSAVEKDPNHLIIDTVNHRSSFIGDVFKPPKHT